MTFRKRARPLVSELDTGEMLYSDVIVDYPGWMVISKIQYERIRLLEAQFWIGEASGEDFDAPLYYLPFDGVHCHSYRLASQEAVGDDDRPVSVFTWVIPAETLTSLDDDDDQQSVNT